MNLHLLSTDSYVQGDIQLKGDIAHADLLYTKCKIVKQELNFCPRHLHGHPPRILCSVVVQKAVLIIFIAKLNKSLIKTRFCDFSFLCI